MNKAGFDYTVLSQYDNSGVLHHDPQFQSRTTNVKEDITNNLTAVHISIQPESTEAKHGTTYTKCSTQGPNYEAGKVDRQAEVWRALINPEGDTLNGIY